MSKKDNLVKHLTPDIVKKYISSYKMPTSISPKAENVYEYIKEIAHHFKKDKWPLSLSSIRSDIITRMIGIDDIAFIASELAKYGINVGYGDIDNNGVLFVDQKKSSTKKKRKGKKK